MKGNLTFEDSRRTRTNSSFTSTWSEQLFKTMKETLDFVMSMEFWRMGLLWTLSLLISYWKLLFAPTPLSASAPPSFQTTSPVCIVTGATSGLGAAAAHALSARGFFVVLGNHAVPFDHSLLLFNLVMGLYCMQLDDRLTCWIR